MILLNNKELIEKLSSISNFKGMLDKTLNETNLKLDELYDIEKRLRDEFENKENRLKKEIASAEEKLENIIQKSNYELNKIIKEKTRGFPWLADAIAQYHYEYIDLKVEEFLRNKLRPAITSAVRVREIAKEKRELKKKFLITRNLIKYYESLFPWLHELVGEDIDDLLVQVEQQSTVAKEKDPAHKYLSDGEWNQLSPMERSQLALDRFWSKKKKSWELGRDYERFVGYLYEKDGFLVSYHGIEYGMADLGRDLICKKDNHVEIVQCKYWKKERTIHHKHITYLFGTAVEYFIQQTEHLSIEQMDLFPELLRSNGVTPTIFTSTTLSETAKKCAQILGVKIIDQYQFKSYPSIKCNVSRRDASKIYHLPFDQQYDRTIVEEERNECYVSTVAEAERLGFRRAWRWQGKKTTNYS